MRSALWLLAGLGTVRKLLKFSVFALEIIGPYITLHRFLSKNCSTFLTCVLIKA